MTATIAWSRRAADELWSGVVTPLTFSVLAEQMAEHMAQQRLRQAGLVEASRQPVFRLIRGHVYVNASLIHDVMLEVPSIFLSDGVLALLPEDLRADLGRRGRALYDPRTLATVLRLTWNERAWAPWSRAELFREESARVAMELGDFEVRPGLSGEEIAAQLGHIRDRLGGFLDVVSWAMVYAYVFFHLAAHLAQEWLPEDESLSFLVAGIPGIRTFEVHEELSVLAHQVRGSTSLRAALIDKSSAAVVEACERGELGAFGTGLLELRRRHGHRLVARDLAFPTWREKPEVLVDMIRRLAVAAPPPPRIDPAEVALRARSKIASGLAGELRWRVFEVGLGWCQEYYAVRENMRYHADYFLAAFRRLALAGAERLVDRGALADVHDVFYLTIEELDAALRRVDAGPDLAGSAARRRRDYDLHRRTVPPEVVRGDGGADDVGASSGEGPVEGPGELRGTPASPGCVEGAARVIRSVDELDLVQAGDVIVATATDPTWASYLSLASGLVLEVGGLLSHGAIIARELGIPAVVDLSGATTTLRSEERIRVDGSRGLVGRISNVPSAR